MCGGVTLSACRGCRGCSGSGEDKSATLPKPPQQRLMSSSAPPAAATLSCSALSVSICTFVLVNQGRFALVKQKEGENLQVVH